MTVKAKARGFTLLEVMVAGAIGLVAMAGTTAALASNSTVHETQVQKTTALSVAENQMEDLLVRLRTDTDLQTGTWGPRYYTGKGIVSSAPSFFTVTWTIEENQPLPNVRRIRVKAAWNNAGGSQKIELVTERL